MQILDFSKLVNELDGREGRCRSDEIENWKKRKTVFNEIIYHASSVEDCRMVETKTLLDMLDDVEAFLGGESISEKKRDEAIAKLIITRNMSECRVV